MVFLQGTPVPFRLLSQVYNTRQYPKEVGVRAENPAVSDPVLLELLEHVSRASSPEVACVEQLL